MPDPAQPESVAPILPPVEAASSEKAIDHPTDPSRNHPIHDAALVTQYAGGRYTVALALDGVSETKSSDRLVPIAGTLRHHFAQFCAERAPEDMRAIVDWFRHTTRDPRYSGLGATTVCLIRYDQRDGIIDGINLGDSVPLMVVDKPVDPERAPANAITAGRVPVQRRGAVLAPLHCVANDPSSVYQCWRWGEPFAPDGFRLALPERFVTVWLVAMSDGFSKITAAAARRLLDLRRVEKILARRYGDFVRVYLPEALAHLAPGLRRPRHGRVHYTAIADNDSLKAAFASYYRAHATPQEREEMKGVDLDTNFLHALVQHRHQPDWDVLGQTVKEHLRHGHRTLRWLARAPLDPQASDQGLEQHLRQYAVAELFAEALVTHLDGTAPASGTPPPPPVPRTPASGTPPPPPVPRTSASGTPPPPPVPRTSVSGTPPPPPVPRTTPGSVPAEQSPLATRLDGFLEGLGQVGDDFCTAVIRIPGGPRTR